MISICGACGTKSREHASFCHECGTSIEQPRDNRVQSAHRVMKGHREVLSQQQAAVSMLRIVSYN